jgi:hypothetical protein
MGVDSKCSSANDDADLIAAITKKVMQELGK